MARWLWKWTRRSAYLVIAVVLTIIVVRAVDSQRGPPLELWHTEAPHEPHAAEPRISAATSVTA